MDDTLTDWQPATKRVEQAVDDDSNGRGWVNTETEEVVIRRPLLADECEQLKYGAYWYLDVSEKTGLGTNRCLLLRGSTPASVDKRIKKYLTAAETPVDPDRLDRALNPTQIRREQINHVTCLRDWAHLTGAKYHMTEKVGNRKRSSGQVALFQGSSRRGKGAYVAVASENGPRGRPFISIGYQSGDFYTTDVSLGHRSAYEIGNPTIEFDGEQIIATGVQQDNKITITPQTGNPDHCLAEDR
jgi:hypothetical protein